MNEKRNSSSAKPEDVSARSHDSPDAEEQIDSFNDILKSENMRASEVKVRLPGEVLWQDPESFFGAAIEQLQRELFDTKDQLQAATFRTEFLDAELLNCRDQLQQSADVLARANQDLAEARQSNDAATDERDRLSHEIQSLLSSLGEATIVLDAQQNIVRFSSEAIRFYGLRPGDIGRPLFELQPRVAELPPLPPPNNLGDETISDQAIASDGGTVFRRLLPLINSAGEREGSVVSFSHKEKAVREPDLFHRLRRKRIFVFDLDIESGAITRDGAIQEVLDAPLGLNRSQYAERIHPDDQQEFTDHFDRCTPLSPSFSITYRFRTDHHGWRWLQDDGETVFDDHNSPVQLIGACSDVSAIIRHESELRRKQRLLELVAAEGTKPIGSLGIDRRFRFASESLAALLGRTAAQLNQESVLEAFGEPMYGQLRGDLNAALDGEKRSVEVRLAADGDVRHLRLNFIPDLDDRGLIDGCHLVIEPPVNSPAGLLTNGLSGSHGLAAATDTVLPMQRVIDNVMHFIGVVDPTGTLIGINESALSVGGLVRNDVINKKIWDCHWWKFDPGVADKIRGAIELAAGGQMVRMDTRLQSHAANEIEFDLQITPVRSQNGHVTHLILSGMDITDRTLTENELAASEHRLALALESAGMGSFEWEPETDQVWWDHRYSQLTGLPEGDRHRSEEFFRLIHEEDVDRFRTSISEALFTGKVFVDEFRITRPDNTTRWIAARGQAVKSEETGITRLVGLNWDITDRKKDQKSFEKATQLAEAANQTKSEFLANMSHEIRTPMTAIIGYLDILSRNLTHEDDLKCVSIIRNNSKFLLGIINDILDISKIEAGKLSMQKKRFQPDQLVSDVKTLMNVRAIEKALELNVRFDGPLPRTIRSDKKRLKQILINLVGNAIKFTDIGSVTLVVSFNKDESLLQFDVIDTGIGVDPRKLSDLFQPFTQGDSSLNREFGGTGLGLPISQRLARLLGGKIVAKSQCGKGSKFTLTTAVGSLRNIAMVEPKLTTVGQVAKPLPREQLLQLDGRILVVDDRREIRSIAQHMIEEAGATSAAAADGQEAIHLIRQAMQDGEPFNLIVMDMQMPVMDGYEATRRLRQSGFKSPIIALTAHAMAGDRQKCLDAGCSDYLTKPLDHDEFISLLASGLQTPEPVDSASPRRIMVVEDQVSAADALAGLLELMDHEVRKAYDGTTAIKLAKRFRPEIVLMDMRLPDMSGIETMNAIRAQGKIQPIFVALTGETDEEKTRAAGFTHHLLKPVDFELLESTIRSIV